MEIVNPCQDVITNFEVLEFLKKMKDTKNKKDMRNLATITYETKAFLQESPCKDQTREGIEAFIKEVKPFKLSKHEVVTIINEVPVCPLDMQLLIEDGEERYSDEQIADILKLVAKYLRPAEQTDQQ